MSDATTPEPASRWYVIPFLSLMFAAGLGLVYLVRDSAPPAAHATRAEPHETQALGQGDALNEELARLEQQLSATSGRIDRLESQAGELLSAQDRFAESQGDLATQVERLGQGLGSLSERLASSLAMAAPTDPDSDASAQPVADSARDERIAAIEAALQEMGARLASLEQGSSALDASQSQLILAQAETLAAERESLLAEMTQMLDAFRAEQAAARRATPAPAGDAPALTDLAREFAPLGARFTAEGLQLTIAESELRFPIGGASLPEGPIASLDRLAELLGARPELRVRLLGHTDSLGEAETNRRLSEARAEAVREGLIARGVAAERIQAEGLGEAEPIADNASAAGRARNRRVEIYLTDAPR
ncbi:MAG: OmpA family protein [Chromatiaceae bacterium]|nr:OmpA family protein [Chromatiaceae bacterium]